MKRGDLRHLIEPATGRVKHLASWREELAGEAVPGLINYGLLAVKGGLILLAGVSLGAVAGVLAVSALGYAAIRNAEAADIQKSFRLRRTGDGALHEVFRFDREEDRLRFTAKYPQMPREFPDDYRKLARTAGLAETPILTICSPDPQAPVYKFDPDDYGPPPADPEEIENEAFMVGDMRGGSCITLGCGLLEKMPADEVLGVVAHEMAHARFDHRGRDHFQGYISFLNCIGTLGALYFCVPAFMMSTGWAGIAAVAGCCIASFSANIYANHMRSRHYERMCDRAGALLTGNADTFKSSLARLAATGRKPGTAERKPDLLDRALSTHPPIPVRIRLLEKMALAHDAQFWAERRAHMADAFTKAAPAPHRNLDGLLADALRGAVQRGFRMQEQLLKSAAGRFKIKQ